MLIKFHKVVIHGVVRKLLTDKQTETDKDKQSQNITSRSISLADVINNVYNYPSFRCYVSIQTLHGLRIYYQHGGKEIDKENTINIKRLS